MMPWKLRARTIKPHSGGGLETRPHAPRWHYCEPDTDDAICGSARYGRIIAERDSVADVPEADRCQRCLALHPPQGEPLTPARMATVLTRHLGVEISYRQILRRLNQQPPVPGAVNHGDGRRSLWLIPNTPEALAALIPNPRGRPPWRNP